MWIWLRPTSRGMTVNWQLSRQSEVSSEQYRLLHLLYEFSLFPRYPAHGAGGWVDGSLLALICGIINVLQPRLRSCQGFDIAANFLGRICFGHHGVKVVLSRVTSVRIRYCNSVRISYCDHPHRTCSTLKLTSRYRVLPCSTVLERPHVPHTEQIYRPT